MSTTISAGEAYVAITCDNTALVRGLQEVASKIDETSRIIAAKETNLTPKVEIDPKPAVDALNDIRSAAESLEKKGRDLNIVFAIDLGTVFHTIKGAALEATQLLGGVGDQFDKMSQRVGVSTDALSEYGHAATMCGADISNIEGALRSMATLTLNASNGQTKATATFKRLGVELDSFRRMTPEEQFDLLASKIASIEDPTRRAAEAMKVFGSDGQKLLPLFASGADGLAQMREEARALGVSIDPVAAKMGADFTDATTRLKESLKGVGLTIAQVLAPTFIDAFNGVAKLISSLTQWARENPILSQTIMTTMGVLVAWIAAVKGASMASTIWAANLVKLKQAITMIQALTGATTALGAMGTVALAAAAAAAVLYVAKLMSASKEINKIQTAAQTTLENGNTERATSKTEIEELELLRKKQAEQKLSTEELARAAEIVAGLKSKYKDVAYEVDTTNGKIKAAAGAQERLNRAMLEQKRNELKNSIAEKQNNIRSGALMRDMADKEVSDVEATIGKQRGSFKMNWAYKDEINPNGGPVQDLKDIKVWQLKLDKDFKKKYMDERKKQEKEIHDQEAQLKALEEALAEPIKEEQLTNITSADLEEGASAIAGFIGKTTVEIKTAVQTQCDAIDEERDKLVKKLRGLIDPSGELDWNDSEKVAEFIGKDANAKILKEQLDSVEASATKQKEDVRQKAEEEANARLAQLDKNNPYNDPDKTAERRINEVRAARAKDREQLEKQRDAAPRRERDYYDKEIEESRKKEQQEIQKIRDNLYDERARKKADEEIEKIRERTAAYKEQLQALIDIENAKGDAKDENVIQSLTERMNAADSDAQKQEEQARKNAQKEEAQKKENDNQRLQTSIDRMVDRFGSPFEKLELAERNLQNAFNQLASANEEGDNEKIASALDRLGEAQEKYLDAQEAAGKLDRAVKSLGGTFDAWQAMSLTQQVNLEKKAYDEARTQTRYLAQIARNIGTAKFA